MTGNVRPLGAAVLKSRQGKAERRIFVLDTNVLMHDPTAIFRFEEHDIYIPMTVLEELDAGKKGLSESARNVRQVSRFLDELMQGATKKQIDRGPRRCRPPYPSITASARPADGCSFRLNCSNRCCRTACRGTVRTTRSWPIRLALQQKFRNARVTLVSKDINLRIKAAILGVHAEDYSSDKTIEDADLLVSGVQQLPPNFWEKHGKGMESWQQQSRTYYRVRGPLVREWKTNQFVYDPGANGVEAIVRKLESDSAILELTTDYRTERNNVWGVTARNREQNLALNLLMDPEIDFVTVSGAGRHRQDLADARGGSGANAGSQSLQRNHHDARHHSSRRGHRLSARHRRRKNGALDGCADGQPGSPDAEPIRRHLGSRRHQRFATAPHQDSISELHARPNLSESLHHHR